MFAMMVFMFFFFLGFVVMFFYLLKRMEEQARAAKDEHAQLRVLLRALESRMDKMAQTERLNALFQGEMEGKVVPALDNEAEHPSARDPLLHLSFEPPSKLDENMGRRLDMQPEPRNWDLELAAKQES